MKPTSKYQQHIMELSNSLPAISDKQKQYAFEHCFAKEGLVCKGKVWCLHCGAEFEAEGDKDKAICPECGAKLKLHNSRKKRHSESWYYTILATKGGYQVCRHFIVAKTIFKGNKEQYLSINEAVQNWIDAKGKETIVARPTKCTPHCYDNWDFREPMEIRRNRYVTYYGINKYQINSIVTYPYRKILPILKRNGYTARYAEAPQSEVFKRLLTDPYAETLIKTRQYSLFSIKCINGFLPHKDEIRIAIRHNYIIKDAPMWFDFLSALQFLGKDTHNPSIICPKNLRKAHDLAVAKKIKVEQKRIAEEKRKQAIKYEKEYKESKGKYFGLIISDDKLTITVIGSVAEMAEEGKAMHHCVYDMEYFKKPKSLILSARDKDGKRVETVEVNLKSYTIVQSRGVCNKNTPYHDEIIQLVNNNMNLIRRA